MKKCLFTIIIPNAIILAGLLFCLYSDNKGEDILNSGTAAIVCAIIGAIVSIVTLIITTLKETHKVSGVKEDTSEIKPCVNTIKTDVSKVKDSVIENIVPVLHENEKNTLSISSKVNSLFDDMEYHNRLRTELSNNIRDKDYFVDGISALYETNSKLNHQVYLLNSELNEEKEKNAILKIKINKLEKENKELHQQVKTQNNERSIDIY